MGLLESIHLPVPCDADWDKMIGDDRKRFCLCCKKDVYNLTAMTSKEATLFISTNEGKVCIRYGRMSEGTVITIDRKLHEITRSRTAVAAGVLAASLTIASAAYSQGKPLLREKDGNIVNSSVVNSRSKTSKISFTIFDAALSRIQSASVELTNEKSGKIFKALTGEDGVAQFNEIPRGRYSVKAFAPNFKIEKSFVVINAPLEPNVEITLEVGGIGEFIIISSDIPLFEAIRQNDNKVVIDLINTGFKIRTKDSDGRTALHAAVEHGNLEIVRFLLERGAEVNPKTKNKRTPILMIDNYEKESSIEILRLLILNGADVNLPNEDNETLLMQASEDDNVELVRILLDAGAKPNPKDDDGETAIQKTTSDEIKQILIRHGAKQPK